MTLNRKPQRASSGVDGLMFLIIFLTILGIVCMVIDYVLDESNATGFLAILDFIAGGVAVELLSIGFTVGVVDRLIRGREKRESELQQRDALRHSTVDKLRRTEDKPTMSRLIQTLRDTGILTDGSMEGEYLRDADLTDANLYNAQLPECNLTGVTLNRAILEQANLSNARLVKADLTDTRLEGANLNGAILQQANLGNANLRNASLIGADLTGVVMNKHTILPDGSEWTPTFDEKRLLDPRYYDNL